MKSGSTATSEQLTHNTMIEAFAVEDTLRSSLRMPRLVRAYQNQRDHPCVRTRSLAGDLMTPTGDQSKLSTTTKSLIFNEPQ